jgi:asparagine synthase (glutamine-hydrolysing)
MSGVAGVWQIDGSPLAPDTLPGMSRPMSHRGPDGSGSWQDEGVGLAHLKLATTPESVDEQLPLSVGPLCVTADARIDNREELIPDLAPGRGGAPSDAELILLAYQRWGDRCVDKLLGDFAFAVWDGRRRALFCARDPFGVKPFYYHHRPGALFAFASEIKGILALQGVPRRVDEVKVADFLAQLYEDLEITFFQGILRLPRAHTLTVGREGLQLRKYWELDSSRVIRCSSDAEYAEEFQRRFREAVRCRLRSSGPVGSMLSGGLDSSSVSCMAAKLLAEQGRGPLQTYSTIFDRSGSADEREFMEIALSAGGMEPNWVQGDGLLPLSGLDSLTERLDEPPFASNLAPSVAVHERASEKVRVLLDGLFGDNALCSYPDYYLAELLRSGRLLPMVRLIRQYARHYPGRGWRAFKAYALKPIVPEGVIAGWRRLRNRRPPPPSKTVMRMDFVSRVGIEARRRQLLGRFHAPFSDARQLHHFELTAGISAAAVELADSLASGVSLEARYPFMDRRLVEFCFGVPSEQKFLGGWPRSLLRRGMAGVLPDPIRLRRGKRGTAQWLATSMALEETRIQSTLSGAIERAAGYLDGDAVRGLYADYTQNPQAAVAQQLWGPLVLAEWLERAEVRGVAKA